ncbi:MAG TPA: ATP synthase F0 subunit B [Terracidiphilus sp.]
MNTNHLAFALAAVLGGLLVFGVASAPIRAAAQAANAAQNPNAGQALSTAPAKTASADAVSPSATVTPGSKSEEEQEQDLLHAPVVQSLARMLHLPLNLTVTLLLAINFAIIFFCIAIPIARLMPKILHKRKETLSQDLKTAREATADAQSRLSAVEAKLAGLGEEMEKFRAQVEHDSLEDEKRIKASISEESARIVAAAEQEIAVAAAQVRRSLRDFAADLAIDQASRELALTPETDRALIAEFVAGAQADAPGKGGRN